MNVTKKNLATFILGFFTLWLFAWILHQAMVFGMHWWGSSQSNIELGYWLSMKFLVWLVYPYYYWHTHVPRIWDFIGLSKTTAKRGYQWGSIAVVIWIALSWVMVLLKHQHFASTFTWPMYVYVALLTPIMEEVVFRGYIIAGLLACKVEGKIANLITTGLFLLVHILGWSFQGVLWANLSSTAWISITLFSLVAGFIRIHSGSLRSSILLHIGNNAFGGFVK